MVQAVRQDTDASGEKATETQRARCDQRGELRLVPGDARSTRRAHLARAFRGAGSRGISLETGIYG